MSLIGTLLKGRYLRASTIAASYDGLSINFVRKELFELAAEGYLVPIGRSFFIVPDFDSEKERKEAAKAIQIAGQHFYNEADTRTEVEVSGALVEDRTFKTQKSLDELLR